MLNIWAFNKLVYSVKKKKNPLIIDSEDYMDLLEI